MRIDPRERLLAENELLRDLIEDLIGENLLLLAAFRTMKSEQRTVADLERKPCDRAQPDAPRQLH